MGEQKTYVAVVDDDESFARAIGRLLRAAGLEAILYPSAEAFLLPVPMPNPDCVILDIHMRGMSGLELQRRLGREGNTTPIIFVTAHDEPEVREQAYSAGCAAYFRKPVPGQCLLDAIRKAAPQKRPLTTDH
ncbi:MAG: two-component system response regulator [Verrucomicrobia bacterium]|nr:MAG: two-component system response regulator [Verrucomicrobiota bacterium]